MGTPYKMKYTNGKKTDAAAFPFKASPGKMMGQAQPASANPEMQEAMQKKIDEVVTKKVDDAVGGENNI